MTTYLVLLTEEDTFVKWETATDTERQQVYDAFRAFSQAVKERGRVVAGEALGDPTTARTLGPGPDRTVTDGPFAEAAEHLGGFYVIDVPDLATALEVASLLPQDYTIEVRECLDVEVS